MDYLSKVSREDLEEMIRVLISDLETDCPELVEKYKAEMDDYIYCISEDEAKELVHKMSPFGEKFTYDMIEQFLESKSIELDDEDIIEYYLVMNMFYNDYKNIFDKYSNLNQKDIYYDFSKAFIEDIDAPKHKVEKYFMMK